MSDRTEFRPGDRVELVRTDDPHTRLRPGDRGTVRRVRAQGDETVVDVTWDGGSSLTLLPEDEVKRL